MDNVIDWVEKNPWIAAIIGLGGLLLILWLLGFFSSSTSQTSSNNGLAAAYYNAEAAQTTAGTQLQMATEAYAAQTAQDQIQAQGALGIAQTQAGMYTTLGQQNASTSTALGNDQLLAAENSNNDALAMANTAASYQYQLGVAQTQANVFNNYANNVLPGELALSGGMATYTTPFGQYDVLPQAYAPTPNALYAAGYSQQGVADLLGLPAGGVVGSPGYTG